MEEIRFFEELEDDYITEETVGLAYAYRFYEASRKEKREMYNVYNTPYEPVFVEQLAEVLKSAGIKEFTITQNEGLIHTLREFEDCGYKLVGLVTVSYYADFGVLGRDLRKCKQSALKLALAE